MLRTPAVAGTWYPADPRVLGAELDRYIQMAPAAPAPAQTVRAIMAPHAGLMYSGATAAAAYGAVRQGGHDVIVLVGPSHFVRFDGVAAWPDGAFATPFGDLRIAAREVEALVGASEAVRVRTDPHIPEHSLEMQLPFLARYLADVPIVPLVMGAQTRATIEALAAALADVFAERHALLVASSDLSHFFDAVTAERLDANSERLVASFDADALLRELERYPEHERGRFVMCGGGPVVSVMLAASALGATAATVIARTHSGAVTGDATRVVGYLAAECWRREVGA